MVEELVDIDKELVVVVVCNVVGECCFFFLVEMVFDLVVNFVDYFIVLVSVLVKIEWEVVVLVECIVEVYGLSGLLVVELFLIKFGELFINEVVF